MTQFPARYILSRIGPDGPIVLADEAELNDAHDANVRLAALCSLETGGIAYAYMLAELDNVETAIAELTAKLEREQNDPLAALAEADRRHREALAAYNGNKDEAEDARPESSAPTVSPHESPDDNDNSITNGSISQLLQMPDITSFRPAWADPHSTDLDLRHGASKVRIEVPHSQVETAAQQMGWYEPCSGSGFWMRP